MKKFFALSGVALALLPTVVSAAPAHQHHGQAMHAKKAAPAAIYECQKCHMKVSAAVAKKDHYKDPMDGGKLVPVASAPAKAAHPGK